MAEDLRDVTLKIHLEAQVKFCYYLLGLTTALLGLSVQFTSPTPDDQFPILVFLSWAALTASLISGISWQQQWINWTGDTYNALVKISDNREQEINQTSDVTDKKILAEFLQVGFLITGLVLFAIYKMLNFYA